MKSIFIVYNQAINERVITMLDRLNVRGFSQWQDVKGRGSKSGEPHMGSHTWPAMNSAIMCIVEPHIASKVMDGVRKLNEKAEMQGIRAFSWNIEETV